MSVRVVVLFLALVLKASNVGAQPATAEQLAACVSAYENAQERRQAGAWLEAQAELAKCGDAVCPAFIRADCGTWSAELGERQPSVVLRVQNAGRTLSNVRVFEAERLISEDQSPIELDPGPHRLRVEADGMSPATLELVLEPGEKMRSIEVELAAIAPLEKARAKAAPSAPAERSNVQPARPWPWVAAGIGAVGVAGFTVLALDGRARERSLQRRCAPECTKSQVGSVRTEYLLADVSLAVGAGALLVAGYLFLSDAPAQYDHASEPVRVSVSTGALACSVGGQF
jgi:hypothetical protein